jgi:hypothetical protein
MYEFLVLGYLLDVCILKICLRKEKLSIERTDNLRKE